VAAAAGRLGSDGFSPHVMTLLRAASPWQQKTPVRIQEETWLPGLDAGPAAPSGEPLRQPRPAGASAAREPLPTNYLRRVRRRALDKEAGIDDRTRIADLRILADSSSRMGKGEQTMQACYHMGVVFDNQGKFEDAVKNYRQMLSLAVSAQNHQVEALACNCLGIDLFKMGQFELAVRYHNKHLELADQRDRMVAHTNLGIAFQAMGMHEHAAVHHQHAVDHANRMGAKDAQCLSVGNLGLVSKAQGDLQTSKLCLEYHLRVAQAQQRRRGASAFAEQTLRTVRHDAHRLLGEVGTSQGCLEDASAHFAEAQQAARHLGDQPEEERAAALRGVAEGLLAMDRHFEALGLTKPALALGATRSPGAGEV